MESTRYQSVNTGAYLPSVVLSLLVIGIAAIGAYNMEHEGHHITGMSNQVIWGMPHVLAIFLIVSASGALNIASIASVFDKAFYKPLARFIRCGRSRSVNRGFGRDIARPRSSGPFDRGHGPTTTSVSIFCLEYYSSIPVFAGLSLIYLWTMLDWQMEAFKRMAGIAAFTWRLILTAGTGSIFGVLVAREAYHIAIMGPMFYRALTGLRHGILYADNQPVFYLRSS